MNLNFLFCSCIFSMFLHQFPAVVALLRPPLRPPLLTHLWRHHTDKQKTKMKESISIKLRKALSKDVNKAVNNSTVLFGVPPVHIWVTLHIKYKRFLKVKVTKNKFSFKYNLIWGLNYWIMVRNYFRIYWNHF